MMDKGKSLITLTQDCLPWYRCCITLFHHHWCCDKISYWVCLWQSFTVNSKCVTRTYPNRSHLTWRLQGRLLDLPPECKCWLSTPISTRQRKEFNNTWSQSYNFFRVNVLTLFVSQTILLLCNIFLFAEMVYLLKEWWNLLISVFKRLAPRADPIDNFSSKNIGSSKFVLSLDYFNNE